jgi:TonB family protein
MRIHFLILLAILGCSGGLPAQQTPDPAQQPDSTGKPAPIRHFNLKDYSRIGGSVSTPEVQSAPLPSAPQCFGTANSAHGKKEIMTILFVGINKQGTIDFAKVVRSGDPEWDKCAVDAVYNWHFKPSMQYGDPVASVLNIEVKYRPPSSNK